MSNPVPPKLSAIKQDGLITNTPNLSLKAAAVASAACEEKARSMNIPMNIAIVDTSLHLLHFQRMPGAKLTSIDIAINKAYTAAGHRLPTGAYKEMVRPGDPAYGINISNQGRFTIIAGGLPIIVDGQCIGAIGCSTGTPAQDEEVAKAGLEALQQEVRKQGQPKSKL